MNHFYYVLSRVFRGSHILVYKPRYPIYSYTKIGGISSITKDKFIAVIRVVIGYEPDDSEVSLELSARQDEIKDIVGNYFNNKNSFELTPVNEEILKREIREILNTQFLKNGKIKLILFEELELRENLY